MYIVIAYEMGFVIGHGSGDSLGKVMLKLIKHPGNYIVVDICNNGMVTSVVYVQEHSQSLPNIKQLTGNATASVSDMPYLIFRDMRWYPLRNMGAFRMKAPIIDMTCHNHHKMFLKYKKQ